MIKIIKNNLPKTIWNQLKLLNTYAELRGDLKESLKQELLNTQYSLCCYCMRKINIKNMQIEHLYPKSTFPHLDLEWTNLYAVCKGETQGDNQQIDIKHCDKKKRDSMLCERIYPSKIEESNIFYTRKGNIGFYENTPDMLEGIDNILNLNNQRFKTIRGEIRKGLSVAKNNDPRKFKSILNLKIKNKEEYLGIYLYELHLLENEEKNP